MLFDGWDPIAGSAIVGTISYVVLVLLLRLSGKRTLSKWNAFDFVVTVALGSSLATALLSRQTAAAQVAAAFALLIALQFVVTWLSVRLRVVDRLAKAQPVYLVDRGRVCETALRRERVTLSELRTAVRGGGLARIEDAAAVVLETDGSFSVLTEVPDGPASALEDVCRL